MRKILLLIILTTGLLITSKKLAAQSAINILFAGDTAYGQSYCSTPTEMNFQLIGNTSGYSFGDTVHITISFGDGTTETTYSLISNGDYFWWEGSHIYSAPGTYSTQFIATGPDGNSDTATVQDDFTLTNTCSSIQGNVYFDNNLDCVIDTSDDPVIGVPVLLKTGTTIVQTTFTNGKGYYYFGGTNGTDYTIELLKPDSFGYVPNCPASGTVSFTATGTHVFNFATKCSNDTAFDLKGDIQGWGFRPGMTGTVYTEVINSTCPPVSGTATLTLDPLLTYISNSWGVAPTSTSANTLTWNFSNLNKDFSWDSGIFSAIEVSTSMSAQLGDSVCLTLSIIPTSGDLNVANNTITKCFEVRNSWDPNMKEVAPTGTGTVGNVKPNPEFTYTVHFQNTGNDVAYNIYIMDTIDADLDMSSLRILSASHKMNPHIISGNILKFDFPNIMLADSNSNEPASHGMVVYKIKAKSDLALGTEIKNTAHIFFDFNPAVVTNTTLNTIADPLAVEKKFNNSMQLFPNPTSGKLSLKLNGESLDGITVTNVLGKTVLKEKIHGSQAEINLSALEEGIYTVTLNSGKKSLQKKIILIR